MPLLGFREFPRLLLTGAVLSAFVFSSCSPSPTQSSMLGPEGEAAETPTVKIVATPIDDEAPDAEEETADPAEEKPKTEGPWGPRPYTPPSPTPGWDPLNPFLFPSWPTQPKKPEPEKKPATPPKTEPKTETKPPVTKPDLSPTLPPPEQKPATPTWNLFDPYQWLRPQPEQKPEQKPVPPKTEPKADPKTSPKPEPEKKPATPPKTEPKKDPGSLWPKPVTPVTPTKPVTPVVPTKPEDDREEKDATNKFDLLKIMTRAFAQSIGVYDRGSLTRPDQLPKSGDGFLKIFQERDRAYGALDLITLITEASREIRREIPAVERVQIGDISDRNGGKLGGHGSHQNGLDADLTYFRKDRVEMPITGSKPGSTGFGAGFVAKGQVIAAFDTEANWKFIQLLDATGRLDRIFVDQRIKKEFCKLAVAKGMRDDWKETLRKLRHWPNHADHMHVRITCPKNSKACKPIPAIPAGDGCTALLDRGGIVRTGGAAYFESKGADEAMGENSDEAHPEEHGC